jgi:FkbM family methyltransferase
MLKAKIKSLLHGMGYEIKKVNLAGGQDPNARYFKSSRDDADYFETPVGNYFLPNNAPGDVVIRTMKNGMYFDKNIIDIAEKYIKPGTCVLDVGANLGQMSIYFSKLVGSSGKVIAFDADDYIYEFLKKNIVANRCDNIETIFGAVYNVSNKVFLFPKQDFKKFQAYGSYGLDLSAKEGREVTSVKIDDLNIQQPISFMKVDIQGSDLFGMQGAEETIRKNKMPIIFEFEQQFQKDFNTSFQDYVDFVDRISYKFEAVVDDINYLIVPK